MALDISKLSEKELVKLRTDVDKTLAKMEKGRLDEARKAAEAAVKKLGFSLTDLVSTSKPAAKKKKAPSPAKFKNPANPSETWSGRGRQPGWYKAAISKGTDPKKLAV